VLERLGIADAIKAKAVTRDLGQRVGRVNSVELVIPGRREAARPESRNTGLSKFAQFRVPSLRTADAPRRRSSCEERRQKAAYAAE
jgi:hypothetical protein